MPFPSRPRLEKRAQIKAKISIDKNSLQLIIVCEYMCLHTDTTFAEVVKEKSLPINWELHL